MGSMLDPRGSASVSDVNMPDDEWYQEFVLDATPEQRAALRYDWLFTARENQILDVPLIMQAASMACPGEEEADDVGGIWFLRCGRGWGKSRCGAQACIDMVEKYGCRRLALVGATQEAVRKIQVLGESGIIEQSKPGNVPEYQSSKARILWPGGQTADFFNGVVPQRLRGYQFDGAWVDEIAAFRYPEQTWKTLRACMRLKTGPCIIVVTTTPNRTCPFVKKEISDKVGTLLTTGRSTENLKNVSGAVKADMRATKGTAWSLQEYGGEDVGDAPGATHTQAQIDRYKITDPDQVPKLSWFVEIVIGLDPNTTRSATADDVGICVVGRGPDGDAYVLGEYGDEGKKMGPEEWAAETLTQFDRCGSYCRRIVAETNAGGQMVRNTLRNHESRNERDKSGRIREPRPRVPEVVEIRSTEDKTDRIEATVPLMCGGRIHFCGHHPRLEQQLTGWVAVDPDTGKRSKSPGALDAYGFAINELFPDSEPFQGGEQSGAYTPTPFEAPEHRVGPIPSFLQGFGQRNS